MPITPLASRPHDHSHCVHSALSDADALCARQGLRLTALRRRVLELVSAEPQAAGRLRHPRGIQATGRSPCKDPNRLPAPGLPRLLQDNGLVHRIASLNAFVGCNHPEHAHQGQFLICRKCHAAIELEQKSISDAIVASARDVGFVVEAQTVEVIGLCSANP